MKYALVTGGSRGIGRAVCLELAAMGYPLLINYLSNDQAALDTRNQVLSCGGKAELLKFDVSNEAEVDDALNNWSASNPADSIEVLVNNAGIRKDNLMIFMNTEQWHEIINIHLNGFFYVTRRVLKDMLSNRYGRIINIVSLSGISGLPGQSNYSAAKAGIIGATKALAQEVGKRNVTVNAIAPGFITTEMIADIDESQTKNMIPLNRFGKPEEVAALVGFLASHKASYITGEVISINGGLHT